MVKLPASPELLPSGPKDDHEDISIQVELTPPPKAMLNTPKHDDEGIPRLVDITPPPKAVLNTVPKPQYAEVETVPVSSLTPPRQNRMSIVLKGGWSKLTSALPQVASPRGEMQGAMIPVLQSPTASLMPASPGSKWNEYKDLYMKQFAFRISIDRGKTFLATSGFLAETCLEAGIAKDTAGLADYNFEKFKEMITHSLADEKGITTAKLLGMLGMKLVQFNDEIYQIGWKAGGWTSKDAFEVIDSQARFEEALQYLESAHKSSPILEFEIYRPRLERREVRAISDGLQVFYPETEENTRNHLVMNVGGGFQAALTVLANLYQNDCKWRFDSEAEIIARFFEVRAISDRARSEEVEVRKAKRKELGDKKVFELCEKVIDRCPMGNRPDIDIARKLLTACDMHVRAAVELWGFRDPRWKLLHQSYKAADKAQVRQLLWMDTGVVDLAADALEQLGYIGYFPQIDQRSESPPPDFSFTGPASPNSASAPSSPRSPTSIPSGPEAEGHSKQHYTSLKKRSITENIKGKVSKPAEQIKKPIKKAAKAIAPKAKEVVPTIDSNNDYEVVGENVYKIGFEGLEMEEETGADIDNNMAPDDTHFNIDEEDMSKGALRLQKLQESTAFHQMSGEEWSGCCRLFQFDVEKKGYADSVPLAGLNRPLFQHQAFGVYWQMKQGRSTFGGGFVADDPGLGKSLTYLAYIVAERQLNWLCDDIEKSRATKDSKHLGAHASGLCPTNSERENWIACPCSKDSVTYGWIKKEGLRLVCVAAPLVPYWRSQWRAHVDTTEPRLRMQLLIAHKGTTKDKEAKGDEDALLPPNVNQLKSVQQEQRAENKSRANQDRFLVVTSPATFFDSWLPKFMYTGDVLVAGATGRGKWEKSQKKLGIVFGIAMVDEFHEEYRISAPRSKVLATLPGRPFCWGYSGTPYGQSPRCLEGILWAIENNASRSPPYGTETGWEQSPAMMPYAHRQLDVVCKQYESYVKAVDKDPRELDEIIKRFIPFVKTFILRRTGETKWHDRRIMQLKPHYHTDVFLKNSYSNPTGMLEVSKRTSQLEASVLSALQEKARAEGRPIPTKLNQASKWTQQSRFRIIGAFPYLASLFPTPLSLNPEEVDAMRKNEQSCLYSKELKQICDASPAWQWLKQFVTEHIVDKTDVNGQEQKLVILTAFPTTAFIIKLMLTQHLSHKKSRIGLIHSLMETPQRIDAVNAFTDELTPRGLRKSKDNFQFLLGTTRMLGTGFTFVRACNLVLIGPDWQHVVEKQAYGRVNRIGQANARSFSYRLVNVGAVVERRIVARQVERREGRGKVVGGGGEGNGDVDGDGEGMVGRLRDMGVCVKGRGGYVVDTEVLKVEGNDGVAGGGRGEGEDQGKEERLEDLHEVEAFWGGEVLGSPTEIAVEA